jgi:hypothetical protein
MRIRFVVAFYKKGEVAFKSYPHVVLAQDNWDDYGRRFICHQTRASNWVL